MKVVLAYSGGLDTSAIVPWLRDKYKAEVVCFCADIGQGEDLKKVAEKAKKTGAFDYEAKIAGLEVRDKYTISFKLKDPDFNFLYVLAMPNVAPVAREVIEMYANDTHAHPVGTGPFLLKEWVRQNRGGNVAIPQFIKLAEQISRQDLDPFFKEWLFTPAKPASLGDSLATARSERTVRMAKKPLLKR